MLDLPVRQSMLCIAIAIFATFFVLTFSAKFQDKTWRRYPQAAGRQRRQNFVNSQ